MRPQCVQTTARGTRCKMPAMEGLELCAVHAGVANVGRPTKLNEQVVQHVETVLRAGGYMETAAAVAGVSKQQFYEWLRRGDPDAEDAADEPYRRFRERVEQARADGEARNVTVIARAAVTNWQAAAWLLERQYPERWGRPSQRKDDDEKPASASDPFAEVDQLAERRRVRQ